MARPRAFDEETVLDRAVNLFWCRGYEATSVQDLVDGLGINRASLYDSFGDKYALYRKALDRYRQTHQAGLCTLLTLDQPAIEVIQTLFDQTIQATISDPDHKGCFMVNSAIELAPHDPEVAKVVADNQQVFEGNLTSLIERGQREGTLTTTHSAPDLARFVFNTLNGLKVLGKVQPERNSLTAVVTVAMTSLRVPAAS
jgi:TetR/AcrR family transcriptional regulator, transcriptional repressor for nem operon